MLLPVRTDRCLRAVPYVTYGILFLNILVHLSTLHFSEAELFQYHQQWGLTFVHPSLLNLFTHAFLHADWNHLLGNMLILWIVGTVLEAGIGSLLFALLYFACLVGAVLLQGIIGKVFQPESLSIHMIGASGAIAGVTGFAAFRYYHIRVLNFLVIPNFFGRADLLPIIPIPYPFWAPFWAYAAYFGGRELIFGLQTLASREVGGVAHWAHLGGMGLGLLTALLLKSYHEGQRESALEGTAKAVSGEAPQERSLEELQRQLRLRPDDPELLEAMAGLALSSGEVDASRVLYGKAIPLFLAENMVERAAISYLNLLHIAPDAVYALREQMSLASSLESHRYDKEAAQAFVLLADAYPQSEEAQTALLRAAQIHHKRLDASETAEAMLVSLLDAHPDSPWNSLVLDRLRDIRRSAGCV